MNPSESDGTLPLDWTAIIDPIGRSGDVNMAIDHALLLDAQRGRARLRLYRWSPPCLSFGRNEPATRRYDRARIAELGLDVVRRPTGGRAVWHDNELTYAIAAPTTSVASTLRGCYLRIHDVLRAALATLGIPATLADRPRTRSARVDAGACFATPAGGEVMVGGRKLVGSAQLEEGGAFLQHGSILFDEGQDLVTDLTVGTPPVIASTSLRTVLGRAPEFAELAEAIVTEAQRAFPGHWNRGDGSTVTPKSGNFGLPSWTWRK